MKDRQLHDLLQHADPEEIAGFDAPGRERVWARITEQTAGTDADAPGKITRRRDWVRILTVAAALAFVCMAAAGGAFLLRHPTEQGAGNETVLTMETYLAAPESTQAPENVPPQTEAETETAAEAPAISGSDSGEGLAETTRADGVYAEPEVRNGPNQPSPYFGSGVWYTNSLRDIEWIGAEGCLASAGTYLCFTGDGSGFLFLEGNGTETPFQYEYHGGDDMNVTFRYPETGEESEAILELKNFTAITLTYPDLRKDTLHYAGEFDPDAHFYSNDELASMTADWFNYFSDGCVRNVTAVTDPDAPDQVILTVEYVSYDPETYTVGRFTAKGDTLDLTGKHLQ